MPKLVSVHSIAKPIFPSVLFAELGFIPLIVMAGFVRSTQKL